ncbi:selenoprotein K-like [Pocillopora verrucosa]|uniref:selenoprotein K-like n=1 Tax=Pocillopora damicornis TaxID=46731 RepID=UPI000F54E35B|nr:selenoprotein K-like [Pocillopora damicornis]XP_058964757.1 selenoprotein K-like [Pocillopora verrucosa]
MVYVSGSNVLERRSIWRLSIFSDVFWGIINFVILFFHTMFSPGLTKHGNSYSNSEYRPGGGPPRPPGRRFGRVGRGGGGAPYNPGPPMGG